jgi:hypothetical protein
MNELFNIDEETKRFIRENLNKENINSIEDAIWHLANRGFSQFQTVYILTEIGQMPFKEANLCVMKSKTWNG